MVRCPGRGRPGLLSDKNSGQPRGLSLHGEEALRLGPQPRPRIFAPCLYEPLPNGVVDDVFRHPLDAFLTAKDAVEEPPLPEPPLEADGPGQQCGSALESVNPCRKGKPLARQLDKEMDVVGHETPGVKNDVVAIGILTELRENGSVHTRFGERSPPPEGADGDEIAPGLGIIETFQARGFSLGPGRAFHAGGTSRGARILRWP